MDSKVTIPIAARASGAVILAGGAWLLSYLLARFLLGKLAPEPHWDIVIASIPVFAFYWFVWVVQRALRNADELQRSIHLEALGLAFLTTLLVLMMLGLLDGAPTGPLWLPLRELWFVLPPLYGVCFLVVSYRYR